MRLILTLLLLALAAPCNASPLLFLMQRGDNSTELFTVNGYSAISEDTVTDTLTETGISTGTGFITVDATCQEVEGDGSYVKLNVNGTEQTLNCVTGSLSGQLSVAVTAGTQSVRVYGAAAGGALFSATNFRKPKP